MMMRARMNSGCLSNNFSAKDVRAMRNSCMYLLLNDTRPANGCELSGAAFLHRTLNPAEPPSAPASCYARLCLALVAQPDLHVAGPASTMVKRIRRRPGRSKPFTPRTQFQERRAAAVHDEIRPFHVQSRRFITKPTIHDACIGPADQQFPSITLSSKALRLRPQPNSA